MKLRNKKTGLDGELHYEPDKEYHFTVATEDPADMQIYRTLAELNAEWEDYKPTEPLIKDEKIRKAVRAWAELNNIQSVTYDEVNHDRGLNIYLFEDNYDENAIIQGYGWIPTLEEGESYTITELCGEEEE